MLGVAVKFQESYSIVHLTETAASLTDCKLDWHLFLQHQHYPTGESKYSGRQPELISIRPNLT